MTQTIVLKVSIDCEACKRKVKKALDGIDGVETIDVDMKQEKVTVVGNVEPKLLVKKLAKIGKKVELPGGQGGGARSENSGESGGKKKGKIIQNAKVASSDMEMMEERRAEEYAHMFSDENTDGCWIM